MNMKFSIFFLLFFFCAIALFSQQKTIPNSFVIKNNKSGLSETFITKSVLNANLETYRLKSERLDIQFKNGFILSLLSVKEVQRSGVNLASDLYNEKLPKGYKFPLFTILDSGLLTAEVFSNSK